MTSGPTGVNVQSRVVLELSVDTDFATMMNRQHLITFALEISKRKSHVIRHVTVSIVYANFTYVSNLGFGPK